MVTLWERMAEMFGNTWSLNYGDPDGKSIQTWTAGLAEYSEAQIRRAVEQMRGWDSSFPPTLGQFAKLCLTKTYTAKPDQKRIAPVRTEAVRKREMERQAAIRKSPKSRDSSDRDVESLAESFRNLNLQSRW